MLTISREATTPETPAAAGGNGFALNASLARAQPENLHVIYEGQPNTDGITAMVNLTNAPETVDVEIDEGLVRYTAPGTTEDATVFVDGIAINGLDNRPITQINGTFQTLKNGVRFQSGDQLVLDAGQGLDGAIATGDLDLVLGAQDPTGTEDDKDGTLDLRMEKLHVGDFELTATNGNIKTPATNPDNHLTLLEEENNYGLAVKLTDVDEIRYLAEQKENCDAHQIQEARLTGAPGNDLLLTRDTNRYSSCSGETENTAWVLGLRDLPGDLRIEGVKIDGWRDVEVESLATSAEGLGEARFWDEGANVHVRLRDFPGDTSTHLWFELGTAVRVYVDPDQGTIGSVDFGFSDKEGNVNAAFALTNVDLKFEIDVDMDTRYRVKFLFVDTDAKPLFGSMRIYGDRFGIGTWLGGVIAEDFQLGVKPTMLPYPGVKPWWNGWVVPYGNVPASGPSALINAELKVGGQWWGIPDAVLETWFR